MNDKECVEFLQWCLPKMDYRWKGFRKVRKQVCKRIIRHITELNLSGFFDYRDYLKNNSEEWEMLDSLCHVSISRFYRDCSVFDRLQFDIFPQLIKSAGENKQEELRCWSIGCCSGEEPYTLNILWHLCVLPEQKTKLPLKILATEKNAYLLERARKAVYPDSSFKDLPSELIPQAFEKQNDEYLLKDHFKTNIEFIEQDIRKWIPNGDFDLVFCRYLAFTYFEQNLQDQMLKKIMEKLRPYGFLIIGTNESLPFEEKMLLPYAKENCIYKKK